MLDDRFHPGSVQQLARRSGCVQRTACRWFTRVLGISTECLLRRLTIYRSYQVIVEEPFIGVEELGLSVGYSGSSALIRAWRDETGVTPGRVAAEIRARERGGKS